MGIRCECPNGHKLHLKSFLAGKKGICPKCQARFRIPRDESPDSPLEANEFSEDKSGNQTASKGSIRIGTNRSNSHSNSSAAILDPPTSSFDSNIDTANDSTPPSEEPGQGVADNFFDEPITIAETGSTIQKEVPPKETSPEPDAPKSLEQVDFSFLYDADAPTQPSATTSKTDVSKTDVSKTDVSKADVSKADVSKADVSEKKDKSSDKVSSKSTMQKVAPLQDSEQPMQEAPPVPAPPVPRKSPPRIDPIAEAPDAIWYVRPPTGGQFGPATGDVMRKWLTEGRVSSDSYVWRDGWEDWQVADTIFADLPSAVSSPVSNRKPAIPDAPTPPGQLAGRRVTSRPGARPKNSMAVGFIVLLSVVSIMLLIGLAYIIMK